MAAAAFERSAYVTVARLLIPQEIKDQVGAHVRAAAVQWA
jgi:hypothetical protein